MVKKLCICLVLIYACLPASAQDRSICRSAPGAIMDVYAVIPLSSKGAKCTVEFFSDLKKHDLGKNTTEKDIAGIVINIKNLDSNMPIDPKLQIYIKSLSAGDPFLHLLWLNRIEPEASLSYVWKLTDERDLKAGAYRCFVSTYGNMGTALHEPVFIDFKLLSSQ